MRVSSIFLSGFLLLSINSIAQERVKTIPIQLEYHHVQNEVTFRHNGYLFIFDQEELLKNYADAADFGWALTVVNTFDTLELSETRKHMDQHRFELKSYTRFFAEIDRCLDAGQVKIITPKLRRLAVIDRFVNQKDPRRYSSSSIYLDPVNGDKIFGYYWGYIGCPNF